VDTLLQDLRYAFRQLVNQPLFTLVSAVTLALGIGATTAIFSAVNAVLLRSLPYGDPERLVLVHERWQGGDGNVAVGHYVDWVERNRSFEHLAAFNGVSFNLSGLGAPERIYGAMVTPNFFSALALPPELGRYFLEGEDQPGRNRVVVLSYPFWRGQFGADPKVLGKEIQLNGEKHTVIGVTPPAYTLSARDEVLWVPLGFTAEQRANYDEHYLLVFGKLKSGTSLMVAERELMTFMKEAERRLPSPLFGRSVRVADLREELVGNYRTQLLVLTGAVVFVLLIACGNIANLMLARANSRQKEMALRAALGAQRRRIARQLLTEGLLLSATGAALGIVVASVGIRFLVSMSPAGIPRLDDAGLSPEVLGFTLLLALLSGLVFGLVPVLRVGKPDLQGALREGGKTSGGVTRDRLRSALVVTEVAVALVLLVAAGLLIRSMIELQRVRPGFDATNVLSARIALPPSSYQQAERTRSTFERILLETSSIPGVKSAALVSQTPLAGPTSSNGLIPEGRAPTPENQIDSELHLVSPGYFETMKIGLARGRDFSSHDGPGSPHVMIVNRTLAARAWPGENPLGKRVACCELNPDGTPVFKEVIGVAEDVRSAGLGQDAGPEFYLPITQAPERSWDWIQRSMNVVLRTTADPSSLGPSIREAVWSVDRALPVYEVQTLGQVLRSSTASTRFNMLLLMMLGAAGLLLAAVGVYGVIAYSVSQRTHELGIRLALGAQPSRVSAMVVRQGAVLGAIGLVLGLTASLAASRVLASLLYGVTPSDPLTHAAVALLLAAVAVLASYLPARRAARVDPVIALRSE
jgi:predicted permease